MSTNPTTRLTVGQAVVRFLAAQRVERDGVEQPFFGGALGIFGHGNVAGIGQALLQYRKDFRLYQGRNEQGMVHIATGYAKMKNRLGAMAVHHLHRPRRHQHDHRRRHRHRQPAARCCACPATSSPAAAPARCCSSSSRASPGTTPPATRSRPSRSTGTGSTGPTSCRTALLEAMRTLTSPADTGAVTLSLPQDVQAEAWDFPDLLFRPRTWYVPRARADRARPATRRPADRRREAAGDHRRRRRHLLRRHRRARRLRRRHRHPGRCHPGRQGQPAVRPPADGQRARRLRVGVRQQARQRGRRHHRHRHPLHRLHHRLQHDVRATPTCSSSTSTSPSSTPTRSPRSAWSATPASRSPS